MSAHTHTYIYCLYVYIRVFVSTMEDSNDECRPWLASFIRLTRKENIDNETRK